MDKKVVIGSLMFALMLSALPTAVSAALPSPTGPKPPTSYGTSPLSISSAFTSSSPSLDGRFQPTSGAFTNAGSTPWPFTAPNEWSGATIFGLFPPGNDASTGWTTSNIVQSFPPNEPTTGPGSKAYWAHLTIPASTGGNPTPTNPPWAPAWVFFMNDGSNLYIMGLINPGNKLCFECPAGSGPSDQMAFFFANAAGTETAVLSWAFNTYGSPTIIEASTIGGNTGSGTITSITCPKATTPGDGYSKGTCPSPTVYEASIPLADLGCTAGQTCTVGFWSFAHTSPSCGSNGDPTTCEFTPPTISSLSTTPSSASAAVGTTISDTADLTLSSVVGATSSGSIQFYLYAGTCSGVTGSALYSNTATVLSSNNGATKGYPSGSFSTGALAAGNYVWLVRYSGGGGWPATPTTGVLLSGLYYACEPITLTTTTHGAPEFPAGLGVLMALAVPAMLFMRRRIPQV